MFFILLIGFVLALIFLPQFLVQKIINKYQLETSNIKGTGGELAHHLLQQFNIKNVTVEKNSVANYYNPTEKKLCLTESTYNDKSVSAITIAAHEIGHALQDKSNSTLLKLRSLSVKILNASRLAGNIFLIISPFLFFLKPTAAAAAVFFYIFVAVLGILVHFFTLPLELDASFSKALPILIEGKYIPKKHVAAARKILAAAAFTYLAAALNNIFFTIFSWKNLIRR